MENAAQAFSILTENFHRITMGLPVMNIDGKVQRKGQLYHFDEYVFLYVPGRCVIVVIKTYFADCHDRRLLLRQTADCLYIARLHTVRFLGMDSYSGIYPVIMPCQFDAGFRSRFT